MARKLKFIDKIVFVNDKYYFNHKVFSPYVFILNMKNSNNSKTNIIIDGIDLHGNERHFSYLRSSMYRDFEILNLRHLEKDFIKVIFEKR